MNHLLAMEKNDTLFTRHDIEVLQKMVSEAHKIVLTCHVSPDGDAMGSTLGLQHILSGMGKHATVVTPDRPPRSLSFLPGMNDVVAASYKPAAAANILATADLVFCLDYNSLKRIDKVQPLLEASPARRILIDHHLYPEDFAQLTISVPKMSSTCELLYHVAIAAGWSELIDTAAASCIYCGMMTDTGNFTYNSSDPQTYIVIADLVSRGIDKNRIYNLACNTFSESCLRLNGYALAEKMRLFPEHKAALITLSLEELHRFGYVKGDTEGLVNKPLTIPGIVWSCFLREDEPTFVKVSMRSVGDFPVNEVCEEHFGGGGHKNASGGEMYSTLDEAVARFESILPLYDKYIKN